MYDGVPQRRCNRSPRGYIDPAKCAADSGYSEPVYVSASVKQITYASVPRNTLDCRNGPGETRATSKASFYQRLQTTDVRKLPMEANKLRVSLSGGPSAEEHVEEWLVCSSLGRGGMASASSGSYSTMEKTWHTTARVSVDTECAAAAAW